MASRKYIALHGKLPREILEIMRRNGISSPLKIIKGMSTSVKNDEDLLERYKVKSVELKEVDGINYIKIKYSVSHWEDSEGGFIEANDNIFLYELSGIEYASLNKNASSVEDPCEIKVTKIKDRFHVRLFVNGKLFSEMSSDDRRDIGYMGKDQLRWASKLGVDSPMAEASRRRNKNWESYGNIRNEKKPGTTASTAKKIPDSLKKLMRKLKLTSTSELEKGMSMTYEDEWDDGTPIEVDVKITKIDADGTICYTEETFGEDGREDYMRFKFKP